MKIALKKQFSYDYVTSLHFVRLPIISVLRDLNRIIHPSSYN